MNRSISLGMVLVCLFATAVSSATDIASRIDVANPWARAVPPGVRTSAAYMEVVNNNDTDHRIVGVFSDVAKSVEIHNHVHEDGLMKMRKMEFVALPSGEEVPFQSGGLHVMLIGLRKVLNRGETIELSLEFEDGSLKMLELPVK